MVATCDLEANGLPEHRLEWCDVAMRRPELELRVATRAQPREVILAMRVQIHTGQRLRMAAVEALGQTNHG